MGHGKSFSYGHPFLIGDINNIFFVDSTKHSECQDALGMENGEIPDEKLKASSQDSDDFGASRGRLHIEKTPLHTAGGWIALNNIDTQWFQIDLYGLYRITRVATQGRNAWSERVTKYKLQHTIGGGVGNQYYKEQGQSAAKVDNTFKIHRKLIDYKCFYHIEGKITEC